MGEVVHPPGIGAELEGLEVFSPGGVDLEPHAIGAAVHGSSVVGDAIAFQLPIRAWTVCRRFFRRGPRARDRRR